MRFNDFIKNDRTNSSIPVQNDVPYTESHSHSLPVELTDKNRLWQTESSSLAPMQLQEKNHLASLDFLQQNLNNCMKIIDDGVMKGYLTKLDHLPINLADQEEIGQLKDIQFFRITALVYQEGEFSLHKLATIFNSLSYRPCTLVMMIKSDGILWSDLQ